MVREKLVILKIGGKLCENEDDLNRLLDLFSEIDGNKLLVHGGGKSASELSEKLGISVKMVDGRRITDLPSLKVAVMVYAGWMNKTIVAKLQKRRNNALGLCGADLGIIKSQKRKVAAIDFGWVGDVEKVDAEQLKILLDTSIVPVFSAITASEEGQLLNTNADTMAAEIAGAMNQFYEVSLFYCFEKPGVLNADGKQVIEKLSETDFKRGIEKGFILEGMIPKLKNGFDAINAGVGEVAVVGLDSLQTALHTGKGGTQLWKS